MFEDKLEKYWSVLGWDTSLLEKHFTPKKRPRKNLNLVEVIDKIKDYFIANKEVQNKVRAEIEEDAFESFDTLTELISLDKGLSISVIGLYKRLYDSEEENLREAVGYLGSWRIRNLVIIRSLLNGIKEITEGLEKEIIEEKEDIELKKYVRIFSLTSFLMANASNIIGKEFIESSDIDFFTLGLLNRPDELIIASIIDNHISRARTFANLIREKYHVNPVNPEIRIFSKDGEILAILPRKEFIFSVLTKWKYSLIFSVAISSDMNLSEINSFYSLFNDDEWTFLVKCCCIIDWARHILRKILAKDIFSIDDKKLCMRELLPVNDLDEIMKKLFLSHRHLREIEKTIESLLPLWIRKHKEITENFLSEKS